MRRARLVATSDRKGRGLKSIVLTEDDMAAVDRQQRGSMSTMKENVFNMRRKSSLCARCAKAAEEWDVVGSSLSQPTR